MKMWGIRSALACASAVGLLALPLAGCGSNTSATVSTTATKAPVVAAPTTSSAVSTPSRSPSPTTRATVAAVPAIRLTVKVGDTVSSAALAEQLESGTRGKSAHVTMTSDSATGLSAQGLVSKSAAGVGSERLTETVAGLKIEFVYVDGVTYMSMPSQGPGWISLRPGGTDPLSRQLAPMLAQLKKGMSGDLGAAGHVVWTVVATSPTTITYRAHASAAQVRANLKKFGLDSPAADRAAAAGEDFTEVVSRSGLPITNTVGHGGRTTLEAHYSGWGPAVRIDPPADYTQV